jgi:UDP-N-acetylmuramoylalanine--D-glutamate ligase
VPPSDVRGKRVSVIGAARSGIAVARLLAAHGALVFVSDSAPARSMGVAAEALAAGGIAHELGGHSERALAADLMVLSPGVPSDAPPVRAARERGVRVVGELEAASWFCPGPVVAITGTNGKTTTTTLVGRMLSDARMAALVGGNIGTAFAQIVSEATAQTRVVLEVSSFQLDHVETFRPRVAVLLNVTPDHLDRYGHSFENYAAAKAKVFRNQGAGDTLVYNEEDPVTRRLVTELAPPGVRLLGFGPERASGEGAWMRAGIMGTTIGGATAELLPAAEISIRGGHNLANAMAAALAARVTGVSAASVRATLRNFKGVEHRLEFVRMVDGVTYVNDSKATNVDSVWYALQSFTAPLVVLVGGRDKGNDYTRLHDLARKHVRAVVAIGESAEKVVRAFQGVVPVLRAEGMTEAVAAARGTARRGDVVLLSPACASFDWFKDYEHRGRVFKEIVMGLQPAAGEAV